MDNAYVPRTQRSLFGNFALWLIALCLLGGAIFGGGFYLKWWFAGQAVNNQAHIFRNSYGTQQALRDHITADLATVNGITVQITETNAADEKSALYAQRKSVLAIVCRDAESVAGDPLPFDQQQFIGANCLDGGVNPSSPYGGNS